MSINKPIIDLKKMISKDDILEPISLTEIAKIQKLKTAKSIHFFEFI